jgi:prephenate dehydrogenase
MKIAIIGGSGKMGAWFGRFFAADGHQVTLIGRNQQRLQDLQRDIGATISGSPAAVSGADLVVMSVPMDSFEEVVRDYRPHVAPGQAVIEITSVKMMPVAAMHRHLKTDKVLGVHPMFGPGARDMANQNFILTPTNDVESRLADKTRSYIEAHDGKVSVMSPADHDNTMAVVLGFPHIVALVAADTLLKMGNFEQLERLGGTTCRLLMTLADSVLTEDPALYAAIQTNLEGMGSLYELFQNNLSAWTDLVRNRDKQGFIDRMAALSEARQKTDARFGKAYDVMYRTLQPPALE